MTTNTASSSPVFRPIVLCLLLICGLITGCSGSRESGSTKHIITSGRVNTQNKFSFTHGRMDISVRLPKTADGLWPAIWMLGEDQSKIWPACGEIDIIEMGGETGIKENSQERFLTSGTHWGEVVSGGGHPAYARHGNFPVSLQDGFHLFSLVRDENRLRVYIDPELDQENNIVNPDNTFFYEMLTNVYDGDFPVGEYFHKPFFIVLNLAAGGDYPGIFGVDGITALNEDNNYTACMYIDYIKVWPNANAQSPLVWEEQFEGDTLNTARWNIEVNDDGGGNNELQSYRKENVTIGQEPVTGKNCLILTVKKQAE